LSVPAVSPDESPPHSPKPPAKPYVYGRPEKASLLAKIMPWILVALGLLAIGTMLAIDTPEPKLHCQNSLRGASLNQFGTCTTDN
jgi:hypothetical protein